MKNLKIISVIFVLFNHFQVNAENNLDSTCRACHGENGVSPNDEWPNLMGQKRTYLLNQLKEFKNGKRANALMTPIAKMLSEKEMEEFARYYSGLGVEK